ncbi:mitochondrial basic amino acids transporter-like isoform X2 [Zophobas morio]|uniref:mitochondrial basic amino acids transporter-like isoform X2 n=1 Tax=Zophobas morio TaxID=2755281 RepID=UPI003082DB5D
MSSVTVKTTEDVKVGLKALVTGASVILEMTTGGLFMENVKMEKQRTSEPYPFICRNILSQGIRGFEAGLWPWGFILGLVKGSVLGGSKAYFDTVYRDFVTDKKKAALAAGFSAGAIQGLFMSPILLARTRVNQSISERAISGVRAMSVWEEMKFSQSILYEGVKRDGIKMLATGMPTCVFKRSMDWGTRFFFIDWIRKSVKDYSGNDQMSNAQQLLTSFAGGAASVTVTMPIDRLMPVIQAATKGSIPVTRVLMDKFRKEGVSTFQRGWTMRTLHTGYHTMFATFVSDKIYKIINES